MLARAAVGCKPMLGCLLTLGPREAEAEIRKGSTMTTRPVIVSGFLMLCAWAATAATDVTGNWTVTITTADGKITGTASLKQTGDKVTGEIGPRADATISIQGVLTATKLTLPSGVPVEAISA